VLAADGNTQTQSASPATTKVIRAARVMASTWKKWSVGQVVQRTV